MGLHERGGVDFDYVIEATRIERLAGKYDYAAKVVRMTRRPRGDGLDDISVVHFREQWGTTEEDALKKVEDIVESWIQRQGSN